jgi:WD40 repeat protein
MKPSSLPPAPGSLTLEPFFFGTRPFRTDGELLGLSFSPDGLLWSLEEPGVLRSWHLSTQRQCSWHELGDVATVWCFGPGARLVAAGSDELTLWKAAAGRLWASWPMPSWVTAIAISPSCEWLATGHDDRLIRVWRLANRKLVQELAGHNGPISALRFSHNGKRLASAAEDRVISVWDFVHGHEVGQLRGHTDRIPALAWYPDGRRLVSAGWDTTARIWYVPTGEPLMLLNSHSGQVQALALSPNGKLLACADARHAVHIWDAQSYRSLQVLPPQGGEVHCLAFHPNSDRLASGGGERLIHLWDLEQGSGVEEGETQPTTCSVSVSGDGRLLASLGAGAPLRLWDVHTGQQASLPEGLPALHIVACSLDGCWLAGSCRAEGSAGETLALWDARRGCQAAVLEGPSAPPTVLAFAPTSCLLASASSLSRDVWLWTVPGGEPALLIADALEQGGVELLVFAGHSRLLAVAGMDWLAPRDQEGQVAIWEVATRRRLALMPIAARALAFDPCAARLAIATVGQAIGIWDVPTQQLRHELTGHLDAITCLAYSPDGRWLASGSDDRTLRLWDAQTGAEHTLVELDTQIKALCFSADGRHLFTSNGNSSCCRLTLNQGPDRPSAVRAAHAASLRAE